MGRLQHNSDELLLAVITLGVASSVSCHIYRASPTNNEPLDITAACCDYPAWYYIPTKYTSYQVSRRSRTAASGEKPETTVAYTIIRARVHPVYNWWIITGGILRLLDTAVVVVVAGANRQNTPHPADKKKEIRIEQDHE